MKRLFIATTILSITLLVSACGSTTKPADYSSTTENINQISSENTVEETSTSQESTENIPETQNEKYKEGDTFKAGNLEITLNKKKLGYKADDPYGMHPLGDDEEFLKCEWNFKNIGESDTYSSIYDFKCYADDKECEQEYFDTDFINTNLGSGREVDFETYYKIPKKAEHIELEYTNMLGGYKAIIEIK